MQETKQYFTALCSSKAERALVQAGQGSAPDALTSAIKAEVAALQPAGPGHDSPADASLPAASPTPAPAATPAATPANTPAARTAAKEDQQEGLSQVHARLQNLLQQLPGQPEVAQAVSHPASQQPAQQNSTLDSVSPISGQELLADAEQRARREERCAALEKQAGQDAAEGRSGAAAAACGGDQPGGAAQSPAASSTPESSPERQELAGAAVESSAVEAAATAVAKTPTSPPVPSSVSVVCGNLAGTFDAVRTMIQLESGKECRPSTVEKMAGKGYGKTWSETIKVDHSNALLAVPIGKWLKSYKRATSTKSPNLKRKRAPAQHAMHGPSSAVISADGTVQAADQAPILPPQSTKALRARSPSKHVCHLPLLRMPSMCRKLTLCSCTLLVFNYAVMG